jgi:ankyrin repeat protein
VKLLIEGGANPNLVNEWKMSPILAAMLKNHFGIVDYLINLDSIDANF